MNITPINDAEAIIEPFWDPRLSGLSEWTAEASGARGLEVSQGWCWVTFAWTGRPSSGPALTMHRDFDLDCSGYDGLVLSVMAPEGSVVRLSAETDCGGRGVTAPPAGRLKRELVLDLEGAGRIGVVRIQIDSDGNGIEQGWFNWIGLRDSELVTRKLEVESFHDPLWPKHLKPPSYKPSFRPSYGLILDEGELSVLRAKHEKMANTESASPFMAAAARAAALRPESMIHDYVNFWGDTRYNRERDHGKHILSHGLNAAIAAHLTRDEALLRLAARYALSIGLCGKWDDGFVCAFPGSDFEHRSFVQSLCAYEVAGILDLAGELFTDVGTDLLLRKLAEDGLGAINFSTWKHEYIFHCNQLAWFTPGRMLATAVLARHYPRIAEHMEIAYRDLCESLDYSILPDGGYVEGPTYFRCVGRDAGLGLYHYSRAVRKELRDVVPDAMRRCGDFGEAVISTDAAADVIPICDARNRHEVISQAIMATLLPGSAWSRMLSKRMDANRGWPAEESSDLAAEAVPMMVDAAIAWNLIDRIPNPSGMGPAFLALPDMGPAVSVREHQGTTVKLFVQGNKSGAGHTHEDKGSFILEFGGETYAVDPGTCDYSHPLASILKNCERHTMLIPIGFSERPHPACPLPVDVKPVAAGDRRHFHAEIDASPGWAGYYRRWRRTWDSPNPLSLSITDDYELAGGKGVEFFWQTMLPVDVDGSTAVIRGLHGRAILHAPDGSTWRVDELALIDGLQHRIALPIHGESGRFTVFVELEPTQ